MDERPHQLLPRQRPFAVQPVRQHGTASGRLVCTQSPSFGCGNGAQQVYGFYRNQTGSQISSTADNVTGPNTQYAYDEFKRLKTTNYNNGQQTFSYSYDRYGNRWQQNAPQGGWAPSFIFDTATSLKAPTPAPSPCRTLPHRRRHPQPTNVSLTSTPNSTTLQQLTKRNHPTRRSAP